MSALRSVAVPGPIGRRVLLRPAGLGAARMARASLYALAVFLVGRVHEVGFTFLAPLRVVLVLGTACVVSALLTPPAGRNPVLVQREVRAVLGLTGLALVMVPFGIWPGGSLGYLLNIYGKVVVLCLLIVALATEPRTIRNLVVALLVGAGLFGIFAFAAGFSKFNTDYALVRSHAHITYDPNDAAMMMVTTLPLAVLGAATFRGMGRLGAASVAVILVLATIRTESRGGFIGLAFVSMLLLFRLRSARARLLIVAAMVTFLAIAAPSSYWNLMHTIWQPRLDVPSSNYEDRGIFTRVEIWGRGLGMFFARPVTGVGIGMYEIASGLTFGRGFWFTAHNSFIQAATELGAIGFAFFVALLVFSVKNARRALQTARADPRLSELGWIAAGVEISLYTYMVLGFALSQAYATSLYFLVGVAAALRIQVERCRGRSGSPS